MKKNDISINIISSFNHANFVSLLKNSSDFNWKINDTDYNQVFQILTDSNAKIWKKKTNITLVWTTPDSVSSEFHKLQQKEKVNADIIKKAAVSPSKLSFPDHEKQKTTIIANSP